MRLKGALDLSFETAKYTMVNNKSRLLENMWKKSK